MPAFICHAGYEVTSDVVHRPPAAQTRRHHYRRCRPLHRRPRAVAEEARRLRAIAEEPDAALPGLGEELRGALISLGITEVWAARFEVAERHLEHGVALARRIGRPFLEFSGLAHQAVIEIYRSFARAAERSRQAIELARRHGWTDEQSGSPKTARTRRPPRSHPS